MKRIKNRNVFLLLTIILSLGITLGAVYFMYQYRDSRENKLKTGMISLNFTENSEVINLSSDVPMIDDLGLKNTPYEFTIENTSKVPINVDIKVDVDNNTSIHLGAVRYGIYIDDKLVKKDYIHNDLILYTYEELLRDESINCKIKFWVDYYYDRPNQTFIGKIKAEGSSRDKLYNGVTVTFDPNGGVVDINSKEVGIGETYGKLPTPTRDGYTFMGWNGKNLINITDINQVSMNGITASAMNGLVKITGTNTSSSSYGILNLTYNMPTLDKDKEYTLSVSPNIAKRGAYVSLNYISTSNVEKSFIYQVDNLYRFKTSSVPEDYNYLKFIFVGIYYNSIDYLDESFSIQLEEGDTATEYEPYFITSKTKVVQNQDHTLKAIWKKNS